MKSKYLSLSSLKRKLLKPCKNIAKFLIKLRPRKPISIKSLRFRRGGRGSKMMTAFRDEGEMDRATELTSISDAAAHHHKAPHPSPLTPAYIRMSGGDDDDHVEEACRSFEKYLVEMIVEEGKVRDLGDVEELLYCWKELSSPVFLDLVCRFYRELCTDLFSTNHLQS